MRRAAALACSLVAASVAIPTQADAACALRGTQNFGRLGHLPPAAVAALGFRMAERGAPFQATDDLGPPPRPPATRFIAARRNGCTIALRYEQGGVALRAETALLELRGNRWVLVRRR